MCKRVKQLSSEARCAVHLKAISLEAHHPEFDTQSIAGSSPPGVFVGRFGYPKVFIGPMVPNVSGNTEILDTPEWWMGKGFDEIVAFRYSLLRGYSKASILDAQKGGRLIETLQDLAMMTKPVDTELVLARPPRKILDLREDSQPVGHRSDVDAVRHCCTPPTALVTSAAAARSRSTIHGRSAASERRPATVTDSTSTTAPCGPSTGRCTLKPSPI